MKYFLPLLLLTLMCYSCNRLVDSQGRTVVLGDTISTASGLKYIYLKKGNGTPIQMNSKVEEYMDLYLNDSDSIFWSTSSEKDSIISFTHGVTSMIPGFEELNGFLVEGDEVIAILPDSIAYGKKGRNGIPPATTLVYNPIVVRKVSEPDTLSHH